MAFPISIEGSVGIAPAPSVDEEQVLTRLRDSLIAETVENVVENAGIVRFRMIRTPRARVARPGGQKWLFWFFDSGQFAARRDGQIWIDYRLSTRWAFWSFLIVGLSVGCGFALLGEGDAPKFGVFWILFWSLAFVGSYRASAKDVRCWLELLVGTNDMLPVKALQYDDP
jgi:hypothetical protein